MINQFTEIKKKLKLITDLRKNLPILTPDKGNGVVLISSFDSYQLLESIFSDKSKLHLIDKDPTLTQLSSLQRYFRTLFNRGKIDEDQVKKLRSQNAIVERAHFLPKLKKGYIHSSLFHPIVDTTSSCY